MTHLIDSSLWVDFTRARSPKALKQFVATFVMSPEAAVAEPIAYEVLRHATDEEAGAIGAQFDTLPMLSTPGGLWTAAAKLGQRCRKKGVTAGSLDLLIAAVALHHDVELLTFDANFEPISRATGLKCKLLRRP